MSPSDDAPAPPSVPRTVPFHRASVGEEEVAEVVDTLRSGWLTTGPKVKRFEAAFASYVGARHAVAVNSCTAGLHLALEAIGLRPGDEVIVPTYTFAATGEVVSYFSARPVLADCRPDTLNIDASTVEPLIGPRTKAIIPVHIAGQACDMDPLLELASRHGIHVVEDAAHALPCSYRGRKVGAISELTAFSFYATKTITTGEGGMVTTDRADYAARIKSMSLHGLSGDAWNRYSDKAKYRYEILDFGFKYNMTDVAAALGIHQLARSDAFHARRCEIAASYTRAFSELEGCVTPQDVGHGAHAWHLYILQIDPGGLSASRDDLIRMLAERGVGTSVHFIPLHLHHAYRKAWGYGPGDFPVAEQAFERAISLPIYPGMTEEDVDLVVSAVRDTLASARR